jgi:pilus assembly protein Flp/PilA
MRAFIRFLKSDEAATAVEYAVMLALIMLTCLVAIRALGDSSSGMWGGNKAKLDAVGF